MEKYLFIQDELHVFGHQDVIDAIAKYANEQKLQMYLLKSPLGNKKYVYADKDSFILLSPHHKITFITCRGILDNVFEDYYEDVIEDIGAISDKFLYKEYIGRTREWKEKLTRKVLSESLLKNINQFYNEAYVEDVVIRRKLELVISLFIGSINDITNVSLDEPKEILDKVKHKIQLFDGDQTNFIYGSLDKKVVTIQGLSGTGKTELLLHKLKELYTENESNRIFFTCHNKILAKNLHERIPAFFNFMKIEQQIEWNKRLWCSNAWGSQGDRDSGLYRYICYFYGISFYTYSQGNSFLQVCQLALQELKKKKEEEGDEWKYAFSYVLVDESQDFDDTFVELCLLVTEKQVYIAGDIFQSIFEDASNHSTEPDFLLSRCYRTDPKTLMFAHALGMGLFESRKLWWLDKKEWQECGYDVQETDGKYILTREPIRRFEDLGDDYDSVRIYSTEQFANGIVFIIKDLIKENPTISVNDIGIILLDDKDYIYDLMKDIGDAIKQQLKWNVNVAYLSKEKVKNALFISNRNNVKGLEFPFVICVTKQITSSSKYRSALYTMLTRSFLRSYLLLQRSDNEGIRKEILAGYSEIKEYKRMTISVPNKDEIKNIKARIRFEGNAKSLAEILKEIFEEKHLTSQQQTIIKDMLIDKVKTTDKDELTMVIENLINII
jgi:superfamily I DNA and RNA helicase